MRRVAWAGVTILVLSIVSVAVRAATDVASPTRSQAQPFASPYVSADMTLEPRPSLATVRTEAPRFFLRPQPRHPWRITHLQRTTLGVVVKAVGAPLIFIASPTNQVYWVEASGDASPEVVAIVSRNSRVQRPLHRVGVVFDVVTGRVILRYFGP